MCLMGGMGIVGALISGLGSMMSGMMQAQAYKQQAALHKRQAQAERQKGAYESQRNERKLKRATGSQRAAFVASGLQLDSGTAQDVMIDTAAELDLDTQAIRYGSVLRSGNEEMSARIAKSNASAAMIGGVAGFISPMISAMGSGFG